MKLGRGIHKIIVTRDLGPNVMPVLQQRRDFNLVVCPEGTKNKQDWLLRNIPGASGLLCMLSDKISAEVVEAAGPNLRVVSTMCVGYDHVNLPALVKNNVRLGNTPDISTNAVADLGVMLALMAARNVKYAMSVVQTGQWPNCPWEPFGFCGPQISPVVNERILHKSSPGQTVGFFGFGQIAQATLARLVNFGVRKFIYTGSPSSSSGTVTPGYAERDAQLAASLGLPADSITRVPLQQLAEESDVLFVIAPGGSSTHHAVDADFLARMKRTAVLVNIGRGTIVDSDALAEALRDGTIWGAGLDVVEGEPHIGADHPLVREPRCVILPHIGSATTSSRVGTGRLAAYNVVAGVLGEEMPSEVDLTGQF
ncbi:hypothetical protein ACEPAF_169 [Sanghuangporus sanghuang]